MVSETREPSPNSDVDGLKRALAAFLSDRADWGELSNDLSDLARASAAQEDALTRQNWLTLADHLASDHHKTQDLPPTLRRFLADNESAQAAARAFEELQSQRQAWHDFVQEEKKNLPQMNTDAHR